MKLAGGLLEQKVFGEWREFWASGGTEEVEKEGGRWRDGQKC